ncbi:MAG TPA: phage tail protein [Ilumatobacteraceae bacterium]|nr:phage tail protein [Ilumatobacteraceae bacterium]HRB02094.1 phage tail protein [Ilumatobacteraceae bacterium]
MSNDGFYEQRTHGAAFLVEVDGIEIGWFSEVSGLTVDIAVEDIQEGGENSYSHKLPGRMTWPNIVLKRGVTQNDSLLTWLTKSSGEGFAAAGNKLTRSSAAITLLAADGTRLRAWNFDGAFPVKWTGPSFAASSTDMAVEELEIAHHGFRARNL